MPVRQCLFDDPDGDTFDDQVEGYTQWTAHQEREEHEWDACFYPSKSYTRSWIGWVFRTGVHGTGYYRDGVADESPTANPLDGLCKVKLELDKVLSTIGDPLVATVEEEGPVIEKGKEVEQTKNEEERYVEGQPGRHHLFPRLRDGAPQGCFAPRLGAMGH